MKTVKIVGGLAGLLVASPATIAAWQVQLDRPQTGLYARGESAVLVLRASREADGEPPHFTLYDERGQQFRELAEATPGTGTVRTIPLPTDRLGYFEVHPVVSNPADLLPAQGSRPAGFLPYAVVDAPYTNLSQKGSRHFVGLSGTTRISQRDGQYFSWELYPWLGVQSVGIHYFWDRMEPKGPVDFEESIRRDVYPKWIREIGFFPYFHLASFPRWAVDASRLPANERMVVSTFRLPPKDHTQYEQYLGRVIPYIMRQYDHLPVRYYEILWEPDIPWGWYGTPGEIVKVFEVAHGVIHRLDPKGMVIGPTLSALATDLPRLEELFEAGLGPYLDAYAVHPYSSYPPEHGNIPGSLQRTRDLLRQYVGRPLLILGTEYGISDTLAGGVLNQAYGQTASLIMMRGEKNDLHMVFYLTDYLAPPGFGIMYNLQDKLPFGPEAVAPKPAFPMLRAAIDQVARTDEVIGRIDYLGADIWGYVFRDGNTLLAALWDASGQDRTITLDTGRDSVEIVDSFGNQSKQQTMDGIIRLPLRRSPYYIRGLDLALFGADRLTPVTHNESVWRVFRGTQARQHIRFGRDLGAGPLTLIFDADATICPDQLRQPVDVHQGAAAEITCAISPTVPPGRYVGYYRLRDETSTVYRGRQPIEVVSELELRRLSPDRYAHGWVLTETVQNVAPFPWSGTRTVRCRNWEVAQPLQLRPGEERRLTVPLGFVPDPSQDYLFETVFRGDQGLTLKRRDQVNFLRILPVASSSGPSTFCPYLHGPPDAAVSDRIWSGIATFPLRGAARRMWKSNPSVTIGGDDDLSAQIGFAHDACSLYILAFVTDNVHRAETPVGLAWQQDSLQLGLDIAPLRKRNANTLTEDAMRTDSEWVFAFTTRGPEIFLNRPAGGSSAETKRLVQQPGLSLIGGRMGTTTVYRIVIPWPLLDPHNVRDGRHLALAVAINDSDHALASYPDRRALRLFDGIVNGKNPTAYGQVIIER